MFRKDTSNHLQPMVILSDEVWFFLLFLFNVLDIIVRYSREYDL